MPDAPIRMLRGPLSSIMIPANEEASLTVSPLPGFPGPLRVLSGTVVMAAPFLYSAVVDAHCPCEASHAPPLTASPQSFGTATATLVAA
jgi:hypothetical protein